ncbi:hypothetical protein AQ490_18515 [Wenjunlia vitaminophila]|uniref:Uncharacterized protein n=1 Tax=Wenjunlia vitaminophila TaxID=76728 RepID=A0A0T6LUN0_WENVI|nr:hypothetical protein [Wenjunlia vitaminophila]KRV49705.1 hypothetical protein AQ490_18515 [Wenjunlia vitaminophila]
MSERTCPHPDRARADQWLAALARRFPELLDALEPSHQTPTPTRGQGRRERHGPGTPVRLNVSEAVQYVTERVLRLENTLRDRCGLPPGSRGTVQVRLGRIAALLDRAGDDPVLLRQVLDEISALTRRCDRALGDAEPVVRLRRRCPLCDSVSLRVFPLRRAVLCVNPACRCAAPACDCRLDTAHRHCWPQDEWGELAARCGATAEELTAALYDQAQVPGVVAR